MKKETRDKKPTDTDNRKAGTKKDSLRKRKSFNAILAIAGIVVLLSGIAVGTWAIIWSFSMDEISNDDDIVQELLNNYFYGDHGCIDAQINVFNNGKVGISNLDESAKERMVVGHIAYYKFSGMTYDQLNGVYQNYFGKDENISRKDSYITQEGTYTANDDGIYQLETANCAPPEFAVCVALDKAYKNKDNNVIKTDLRIYTVNENTGEIYSGIDTSVDPLGDQEVTADIDNIDLPKWEVTFKKDKDLDLFIIDSTRKM